MPLVIRQGGCTSTFFSWDGVPIRPSTANENPLSWSLDADTLGNKDHWKWIVGDE